MNEKFNLNDVLTEMENKNEEATHIKGSNVLLSQLNASPEPEKRKMFQNKKANIALIVTSAIIVLAFAAFMIIPSFLH